MEFSVQRMRLELIQPSDISISTNCDKHYEGKVGVSWGMWIPDQLWQMSKGFPEEVMIVLK